MKKFRFLSGWWFLILAACGGNNDSLPGSGDTFPLRMQLPEVLYVTTGVNLDAEDTNLPSDVAAALHIFQRARIPVRLAPRDILWDRETLAGHPFLILSTSEGVHDADRKYSLSYMTDAELEIIRDYVRAGGFLVAGDNVGRNDFEGNDRILETGRLDPTVYPLAEVFGYVLKEKNLRDYRLVSDGQWEVPPLRITGYDLWLPVADSLLSDAVEVWACWVKDGDSIPAVTFHPYGRGGALALTMSGFLKPAAAGGLFPHSVIDSMFNRLARRRDGDRRVRIHPWPSGAPAALHVGFNPGGDAERYRFVLERAEAGGWRPTFFVHGQTEPGIREMLEKAGVELASAGYAYTDYDRLDFSGAVTDIRLNEYVWKRNFRGFRFPFTDPTFEGLQVLTENGYAYESSLTADNFSALRGSNVPYNLVYSIGTFYADTPLREYAPLLHDDYYFLHALEEGGYAVPGALERDVTRMRDYLRDYWRQTVLPVKGLMVFIAHPSLSGYNALTFSALDSLIRHARSDGAWIASLGEIDRHTRAVSEVRSRYDAEKGVLNLVFPYEVKNFTLHTSFDPEGVRIHPSTPVRRAAAPDGGYYLIFDARPRMRLIFPGNKS
ncbi:MAG: hypothetical protein GXO27_05340 [Chlorobi bacterium]|nr:hypothetical protein [Chlorobiota bacterium]